MFLFVLCVFGSFPGFSQFYAILRSVVLFVQAPALVRKYCVLVN